MEENQTVQQESSEASAPEPDIATVKPKPNKMLDFLQRLIIYCPWLLVVVLLALFIGGGAASLYSLSHVEDVEPKQTSETTTELVEVVNPITEPSENTNPLPLWMVGAIAFSCASGCVVILRWMNRPIHIQTTHKHVNRYEARLAQRRQRDIENSASKNTLLIVPPPQAKAPTPSTAIKKTKQMVTILPSMQNQVVGNKESLADSMDIRKEKSLSSMLHKDR
jgi:hypothetical protein